MKKKKYPQKYPCVQQHDEEDCGPACIASICQYFGSTFTLSHIRELTGTGQLGTTLLGLKRGAEALGLDVRSVKAKPSNIDQKQKLLPGIIHWKGNHFVVLYRKRGRKYIVADPAVGIRYLDPDELESGWQTGSILTLKPDWRFYSQPEVRLEGIGRFFKRVLLHRHIVFLAVLINILLGLLGLASPILIQILTDDVLVRGDTQLLARVAIAVIIMNFISSSGTWLQSRIVVWFSQKLELGLILEFARQILRLPLSYYEQRRSGETVSRLDDISEVNQLVSQVVVSLPSQFFIALVSLGFMLFYSPILTGLTAVIAILMTLSTIIFQPILEQKTRSLMVLDSENQGVLVETFKGAITLKTTTAFPQFWEEFQLRFNRLGNLTLDTFKIGITNDVFSDFVANIGSIALLWYGSTLVIAGELSIGQLLAFHAMNENVTSFIGTLVEFVDEFTRAKTATQRLTEVIDEKPETQDDTKKAWVKISGDADITCTQINFHYPGRVNILQDFSLKIPGGKVTAVIGKSGCGKSTLGKIIAGLYLLETDKNKYNNAGNIRFGFYNLKDLSLDCVRTQVVLVPQEAHFWSRSIKENFHLGSPQLTDEQIFWACEMTGAHEFISQLPNSYKTVLGEFGANLSGGQKQRLALARGIINDPPVLILDESTAALDPVSETEVLDKILDYRQGKTTIMISHRQSVFLRADWIIRLDNGQLKIQGSPRDLNENYDF